MSAYKKTQNNGWEALSSWYMELKPEIQCEEKYGTAVGLLIGASVIQCFDALWDFEIIAYRKKYQL